MADLRIPILPFDLTFFQFVLIFSHYLKKDFVTFRHFSLHLLASTLAGTSQYWSALVGTGRHWSTLVGTSRHWSALVGTCWHQGMGIRIMEGDWVRPGEH